MAKTTLPPMWWPLMRGCTVKLDHCPVCGRNHPLEQHHPVKRSAGELFENGRKAKKPTITLCGFGNNLQDSDGRNYCHGLAHANMLHFRWVETAQTVKSTGHVLTGGHWEYLLCDEPTKYQTAIEMDGWRPLC